MATDNIPIAVQTDETGKKVATRSRTEDAVTKHWERRHIHRGYDQDGAYMAHSGNLTVSASAHSGLTGASGHMFLVNPVGSGKSLFIQQLHMMCGFTASLVVANPADISIFTSTFTGTLSASTLTVAKRRTSDTTPVGLTALASTGLTIAGGGTLARVGYIGMLPMQLTAATVQTSMPTIATLEFGEGEMPVLEAGGVAMIKQTLAGVASDTRRLVIEIFWREVSTEF